MTKKRTNAAPKSAKGAASSMSDSEKILRAGRVIGLRPSLVQRWTELLKRTPLWRLSGVWALLAQSVSTIWRWTEFFLCMTLFSMTCFYDGCVYLKTQLSKSLKR